MEWLDTVALVVFFTLFVLWWGEFALRLLCVLILGIAEGVQAILDRREARRESADD